MKRDWELIRYIFKLAEESLPLRLEDVKGYDPEIVMKHVLLLSEAWFLNAKFSTDYFIITDITWDGYEFFDKIKSNSVWQEVKRVAAEKGLLLCFDVIRILSGKVIQETIFK